ncbi:MULTISPECIES: hypothetical protein [unclassified Sulfitobacter]|uniref:hypothetical protein n=1 Tax=unclassified Sulfitobacter TaxID=196795 RepID=UPI0023E23D38|nr:MULTISPECIES: hypothetical protein [unclassified Sulfitobacter]MDF3384713.1 hypothetical protein [Sulfitobacter sp. Ks11]MDF3387932.1 hypothetical protein [Sulfitobacter sp. M85]MDF3391352.1 hypothetical protein [Sulfitobacter sp. Ks16]MDF3402189.1 hypothetical protein [Sulfitobacter sp. KE39]MDF3405411.1 hypothetical protein [Sulfitobacter sp. Ks35]
MGKQVIHITLAALSLMASPLGAEDIASSACPYHTSDEPILVFPMGFERFLDGPDVQVAVPEGYIRPFERKRYARDGTDGAARLFVEIPSFAPMYLADGPSSSFRLETSVPQEDRGTILLGPGVPLEEHLAAVVGPDAAASAIKTGDPSDGSSATDMPDGLQAVPGALLGQTLVAVEDGTVTFLANCQDGRVPICTGRVTRDVLTAQLTFRRLHLDAWRDIRQRTDALLRCFLTNQPSPALE